MNKKEIYMAGPSITDHEVNTVMDALKNGWYGKDAYYYVEKFEKEFSKYHDRKFALMTPNCTTALHLLLTGLGIKDDDEVIVPDCTWVGSVAGITYLRAKTIFADIDKNNWCLSAKTIEEKITEKTKAVIVVDLYGNMPNYKEIEKLCKDKNLFLIEDSAEALGSKYDGIRAGKFGIGSTFSFHRTKTITTGEGGMLLIDDEKLYDRCKFLRDHGRQPGTYFNTEITYKYMPFNVQAALGLAQFQRIDELVEKKRWIWNGFKERLSDIEDIYFNPEDSLTYNSVWATALILGDSHKLDRDSLLKAMNEINLPIRPFFYPLSSLPAFNEENIYKSLNLNSYKISRKGVNLPCALNLDEDNLDFYSEKLKEILIDNR